MRVVNVENLIRNVKEMCIEANHFLTDDMNQALKRAADAEKSPLGKKILCQLQDNLDIAAKDQIPICQDTGMAVLFVEIGQDVHVEGGLITDAVNEGVRQGYREGYLRKSVVGDPIIRNNTGGISGPALLPIVLTAVKDAGPNACPPMVVGVGIGGTFEKCALLSKLALTRPVGEHSPIPYVSDMERELLEKINKTGIGPGGLGGSTTALAVNINTYPTHIAGLPVAVNICCHVNRHCVRIL